MEESRVKFKAFGKEPDDDSHTITIGGLKKEELEKLKGFIHGQEWVSVKDGRIAFSSTKTPLPSPAEDEAMMPFWRRPNVEEKELLSQKRFDGFAKNWPPFSPSILIQHLCGYNFTPENYMRQSAKLTSYGFVCCRSQRGDDGEYWEVWYLPGLFAANGDLKKALADARIGKVKAEVDAAVSFLCRHSSFGTLDVVAQRAAMVIDD